METASGRFTSTQSKEFGRACAAAYAASEGGTRTNLSEYVAMFELASNHGQVTLAFLKRMCGV